MSARVSIQGASVRFLFDRQRRPVTPLAARLRRHCTQTWGVRNASLEIAPGESVALLGPNGAGKTTLLRLIGGIFEPDAGSAEVRGRVGTLLSVEGGFMPLLTGRENALLVGSLADLSGSELRAALPRIVERSGLQGSFERPVSSFSQGMRARLGFAVAEETRPDILLLDEVHEALDWRFRLTVEARVERILADGGIVVAAGHDHDLLRRLCSRAVLLEEGTVSANGPFEEVYDRYLALHTPLVAADDEASGESWGPGSRRR